ncbi:hypothetical protein [Bifidobacterium callitrichos]|nr:hypothetical protein [Bifidobacterium callitrichos]
MGHHWGAVNTGKGTGDAEDAEDAGKTGNAESSANNHVICEGNVLI